MGNITHMMRETPGREYCMTEFLYDGNHLLSSSNYTNSNLGVGNGLDYAAHPAAASAARLSRAAARGILRISKMRFLRRGTSCVGSFYYLCADREKIWPRSLAE